MSGKVTILLSSVCVALAIVIIVIFVNTSSILNDKDILITSLQDQVDVLDLEQENLQDQVDALVITPKEWQYVGDSSFSTSPSSTTYTIEGDKWRITYDFSVWGNVGISGAVWNIRIYDEEGYLVGGIPLADRRNEKGFDYIHQGKGDYNIILQGMYPYGEDSGFTFDFIIESYH